jgi:hypothetical protein
MSQQELLVRVLSTLNTIGVDYMVTGSLTSSFYGQPRSTHDIDLVVVLTPANIRSLLDAFPPPAFYLSAEAIDEAVRRQSMFNLLSIDDGEKVDFWMLTDEPFDRSRFARKRQEYLENVLAPLAAPEDTILAKLRWAKLSGGSEKQMMDALHVFEVQGSGLDRQYLEHWVDRLGVADLWQRILTEAKPI